MTSLNPINHTQAKALAALIHELRPDWDEPGIVAAVGAARGRADPVELCVAALRAAADQGNRTPAVVGMDGRHWRAGDPTPRTATGVVNGRCRACSGFHPAGGVCVPPVLAADPSVAAEVAARIRGMLPASRDQRTRKGSGR